jgi:hypothetical protein
MLVEAEEVVLLALRVLVELVAAGTEQYLLQMEVLELLTQEEEVVVVVALVAQAALAS